MKIVTVNVPESYIDAIGKLIGENGLYPSRSELIRVAVREFLLKELRMAKNWSIHNDNNIESEGQQTIKSKPYEDPSNYIRVPKSNIHTFQCPRCENQVERPNSDTTYYCPYCPYTNIAMKLVSTRQEPVREFKTYKILARLENPN